MARSRIEGPTAPGPKASLSEARRTQTIAVVAVVSIILNLFFSSLYFVAIDPNASSWLLVVNILIVAGYAGALVLNRRGFQDGAMWAVCTTGLANTVLASLLLGLGSMAFFIVVPLAAILTGRPGDRVVPGLFTGAAVAAVVAVVAVDPQVPDAVAGTVWESVMLGGNVASVVVFAAIVSLHYRRRVDVAEARLADAHARSEALLLNILPRSTADRLKAGERPIADSADEVSVLFADLVGSTPLAEALPAEELVALLSGIFSSFDDFADRFGLEKIKTVGDAYIAVAGLPTARSDHLEAAADMALAMRDELRDRPNGPWGRLDMRLGLHAGPVVAGVIGKRKFSYDLWGDTVNIAARMESHGVPGEIQVTRLVHDRLGELFDFTPRGVIDVKGKGPMETFLLVGRRQVANGSSAGASTGHEDS